MSTYKKPSIIFQRDLPALKRIYLCKLHETLDKEACSVYPLGSMYPQQLENARIEFIMDSIEDEVEKMICNPRLAYQPGNQAKYIHAVKEIIHTATYYDLQKLVKKYTRVLNLSTVIDRKWIKDKLKLSEGVEPTQFIRERITKNFELLTPHVIFALNPNEAYTINLYKREFNEKLCSYKKRGKKLREKREEEDKNNPKELIFQNYSDPVPMVTNEPAYPVLFPNTVRALYDPFYYYHNSWSQKRACMGHTYTQNLDDIDKLAEQNKEPLPDMVLIP